MLWFNFILGSISLFCTHYHTLPYTETKKKNGPRIKLNHNMYNAHLLTVHMPLGIGWTLNCYLSVCFSPVNEAIFLGEVRQNL